MRRSAGEVRRLTAAVGGGRLGGSVGVCPNGRYRVAWNYLSITGQVVRQVYYVDNASTASEAVNFVRREFRFLKDVRIESVNPV